MGGVWTLILSYPTPAKLLSPGRIILINHKECVNVACIILSTDTRSKERKHSVLVLESQLEDSMQELRLDSDSSSQQDSRCLLMLSVAMNSLHTITPTGQQEHSIVTIKDDQIIGITATALKIDADKIVKDVTKREIPRFRSDPPGQSVSTAIEGLIKNSQNLDVLSPRKEFRIQEIELQLRLQKMEEFENELKRFESNSAEFRQIFEKVYSVKSKEEELDRCNYLCSEASLSLLPEYHNRINVLTNLKYIDNQRTVQLKGRVACEMGSNELIVTELVFNNQLTDRPPEEIAALLSCLVFQQRNCSAPELTPALEQGVKDIKSIATRIGQIQVDCGLLQPVGEYVDSFKFGLVEVVYEWARGMPFSDITKLTDVQEGIIVRTIQRLDESLRDVKDAARVIGDPVLYQKMDQASTIIKRDIVFAASLYTQ